MSDILPSSHEEAEIILSLRNICKSYSQGDAVIEVLNDISFDLHRGESMAITGASGRGKSTLLHIAGLLDAPDSGQVYIQGVNEAQLKNLQNSSAIRLKKMGFIYQYHHLLRDFTAEENVAMPLLISGTGKSKALERARELLNEVRLGHRLQNLPGQLSGGEQQRVAIARALINMPEIILADEPTGNLDPHTADEVFELFMSYVKTHGTAVVMVSHNHQLSQKMHKQLSLT